MFSLIISIIAIALVAALAGASVYYGGAAFSNNGAKADASTLINHGQQINGAYQLAIAESDSNVTTSAGSADLSELETEEYLTSIPDSVDGTAYSVNGDGYMNVEVGEEVCLEIQKRAGTDTSGALTTGNTLSGLFDCAEATGVHTFGYKVL